MPDQRIVFFARSNWLLKLHFQEFFWISRANFPSVLRKKEKLFGAGYPLVWYQIFTSVSVKSGRYLPRHFAARQMSSTIHLHFGE